MMALALSVEKVAQRWLKKQFYRRDYPKPERATDVPDTLRFHCLIDEDFRQADTMVGHDFVYCLCINVA